MLQHSIISIVISIIYNYNIIVGAKLCHELKHTIFFFYWSRTRQLWQLAIVEVKICRVGTVGMIGTFGWQHVYVWQGFSHYGPRWTPIRELVAAAVAYSQSRCAIDFSHCAAPSHTIFLIIPIMDASSEYPVLLNKRI